MIGRTLDHYRIESKLGEGGMGVVYKALDTHLNRLVAIKVLPRDKVADPIRKQRFVQEARAASAFNHANIVTVYDIRSDGGVDFIVMEYIEGQTLDKLIPAKGLRPAQALRFAVQITDALAKAHSASILHRDLKPSNIMVTGEGHIKVLDFGLAKLLEPAESSEEDSTVTERLLTREGTVMGTVAYMSPEQAEGRTLDARSDIFSFGSVLYELVTNQKPFTGDSSLSILSKILNQDPTPPSQLIASIPPELEKLILRCLRKDAARRYQTMADLKVALEDLVSESGPRNQVQTPSRRRWVWAAVAPLLMATGFFAWQQWRAQIGMQPLRAVALTTFPGVEIYPSFSPDGNQVAFAWNGSKQDNFDIYVQMIGLGSPLQLTTDPRSDYNPVWSPDGRWIAFLRGQSSGLFALSGKGELRLIPPLGGPERKLAEIWVQKAYLSNRSREPFSYLAWCPDSNCLVVTDSPGAGRPDALFVVSLETGEKRQITNPEPPLLGDSNPAVAPDGRPSGDARL
jgi:Kae1-associated kinase Bud32